MSITGPAAIWGTVNPADLHSLLLLELAGQYVALEDLLGINVPSALDRARAVAKDPVATARFYHKVTSAVFELLVGSDRDGGQKGVFGRAIAHYCCNECQGRGSMHGHFMVWLSGQKDSQELIDELMADENAELRQRFCHYLDSIISSDFDSIFDDETENIENGQTTGVRFDNRHPSIRQPPTPFDVSMEDYIASMESDRLAVSSINDNTRHSSHAFA